MKITGVFQRSIIHLFVCGFIFLFILSSSGVLFAQSASHVVISEIYGGGGNSGSTYTNDFIELYNPTDTAVSLMGWSLQYASATGSTWQVTNLAGNIEPHRYFLIQEAKGSGGSISLPTPDVAGTISLASTSGKIVLLNGTSALIGTNPVSSSIVDKVGFGSTATDYEGSEPAPSPSNSASIERKAVTASTSNSMAVGGLDEFKGNGFDSDNNKDDFIQRSMPQPQNSASSFEPSNDTSGNGIGTAAISPSFINASEITDLTIKIAGDSTNSIYSILVEIPDSSGWLWSKNNSDIEVSGKSADSAVVTILGDTIFVSSLALTETDSLIIKISNITAPSMEGYSSFKILTAIPGGVSAPISQFPGIRIIKVVPIVQIHVNDSNGVPAAPYAVGTTVSISGVITADYNSASTDVYVQDATAGIDVYSSTRLLDFKIGDSVTVTGSIIQFRGLTEISPDKNLFIIHSHNNKIPEPLVLTAEDVNSTFVTDDYSEPNEGRLVRINGVTYNSSNQTVTDATGTTGAYLGNISAPSGTFDLIGILKQYKSGSPAVPPYTSGYEVNPRSSDDIITNSGPQFVTKPVEKNILSNSVTISFKTLQPCEAVIKFGTSNLYSDSIVVTKDDTLHEVVLPGLKPAAIYHYQVGARDAAGTNYTGDELFLTSSLGSSGTINVFFNHSVDNSVSAGEDAQNINISQEFLRHISSAQYSIDAALYSLSGTVGSSIANALIAAKNRGVKVRVIGEYDNSGTAPWSTLKNAGIPVIFDNYDPQNGGGLMHNKFAVFDNSDSSDTNDWIWSGSWNATDPGNNNDAQNVVEIQDKAIANAYTVEFEEMWGSNTETPNSSNSKFGISKTDNTPHHFNIASTPVDLYFDPSDNTTSHIADALNESVSSINVAMLTFTRSDLAQILINKKAEGEKVHVILDNKSDTGNQFSFLKNNGVDVLLKGSAVSGLLHHKYAVVDGDTRSADQMVITGSHNWSNSAENSNNENTLIIHSYRIANLYLQEFKARYLEAGGTDIISRIEDQPDNERPLRFNLSQNFPNPFNPTTVINYQLASSSHVILKIFNILGQEIKTLVDKNEHAGNYSIQFDASGLSSGIYFYSLTAGSFRQVRKMILLR